MACIDGWGNPAVGHLDELRVETVVVVAIIALRSRQSEFVEENSSSRKKTCSHLREHLKTSLLPAQIEVPFFLDGQVSPRIFLELEFSS
ncbi:MAG: hypothetical protein K5859_06550 [Atopobiaceae bacterium]|nr:hypothetical protein [Atopobiaceae bacterium]